MLDLHGLFIPPKVLDDENLSDKEKHIFSIILLLSKNNKYCYCTNKTIGKILHISTTQVSKLINSLKNKKYIEIVLIYKEGSKQITGRKLIPIKEINYRYLTKIKDSYKRNDQEAIQDKLKDNKYINKNINNKYIEEKKATKNSINYEQRDYSELDFSKLYANFDKLNK